MNEEFQVIGKRIPRIESVPKVTGSLKYIDDMVLPGMLYGKFLRSPYAHAKVGKIDVSKAESLPGVKLILTPRDIIEKIPTLGPIPPKNQYLLEEEVRYVGDEVAAVAAVDEETAEKAISLITVEYEELPAIFDPEEAMSPEAPQLHAESRNTRDHLKVRAGDIEEGFKKADHIFKIRFQTSKQAHVALEPHGCVSSYDTSTGKLTHWSPVQGMMPTWFALYTALNLPAHKVRVITSEGNGGGFGSKGRAYKHDVCAAFMSMKLGKPVKMILSREEVFMATTTRHPCIRESEIGLKEDGTIVAWRERAILDIGAYAGYGKWIAIFGDGSALGPYKIPNVWIDTYLAYTNKSLGGAMRGFGNPQVTFARESLLDIAAGQMGIDRLELRLKNIIKPQDLPFKTSTGRIVRSCGIEECIKKAADAIEWTRRRKPYAGVGLACMVHQTSVKFGPQDPDMEFAGAEAEVLPSGCVIIRTGNSDVGQGLYTTLAQIAAEELGIPVEKVTVVRADSEATPLDIGAIASRSAYSTGFAVKKAVIEAREKLLRIAGKMLRAKEEDLTIRQGKIYLTKDPGKFVAIEDVIAAAYFTAIDGGAEPVIGRGTWTSKAERLNADGCGNFSPAYAFGVAAAEVEIDPETGQVKVTRFITAHDVGKALNPDIVEGQLHGGAVLGIGWGLFENMIYDNKTGQLLNPLLIDYKVPTAADLPDIQHIIVETTEPDSPYGNKAVGETAVNCAAAAIANAVYDAARIRITELPIRPEKILRALKERSTHVRI